MPLLEPSEFDMVWNQLVTKAWNNKAFKKRLLADPAAVLKEAGFNFGPGVQIKALENTENILNLVVPQKPPGEVSNASLEEVIAAYEPRLAS